jgi:hypothetical protein
MAKSKSLNSEQQAAIETVKQNIKARIDEESISLSQAIQVFKDSLDNSIIIAGEKGKESLIRSQEPIKIFHEVIKQELINNGVNPNLIHPALGQ